MNVVEFVTLHGDVFTEIFISVHTSSEKLAVWDFARNSIDSGGVASRELDETGSGWGGLSVWWLVEEGWAISVRDWLLSQGGFS